MTADAGEAARANIALFPLRAVLFPSTCMPLRIFEPRYFSMVAECMRQGAGFGVATIQAGDETVGETWQAPQLRPIGTYAEIRDWESLRAQQLGLTIQGMRRFRLGEVSVSAQRLLRADVEFLPDEPASELPEGHSDLVDLLRTLQRHPLASRLALSVNCADASRVGHALGQLLPMPLEKKYRLLAGEDALQRLASISEWLRTTRAEH